MEKRLGKGLAQIIETSLQASPNVVLLRTDQIRPSRYQPRERIDERMLDELKASITRHGVIQPIVVRPIAHGIYELVAGERRWRAAQALGIPEVPVLIRALSDQDSAEYSLIENLHREDLSALERAKAFERLMSEFQYTQETLAQITGRDRSSIANSLRLLKLPEEIQAALKEGKLTEGHAKVLLGVEPTSRQLELARHAIAQGLSIRQLEQLAGQWQPRARRRRTQDPQLAAIEEQLRQALGTKISLTGRKRGGRIVIEYFSSEDLARILRLLGV